MFSSLRARLTISHLAVIILAMGLVSFMLLSFLEQYFLQAAEESLLAQARITAQALLPGVMAEQPSVEGSPENATLAPAFNTVQQQLTSNLALQAENFSLPPDTTSLSTADLTFLSDASLQLSTQLETRIRILDEQGDVLVDSGQHTGFPSSSDLRTDPLVIRALEGEHASRIERGSGAPTMHLALPALVGDRPVGLVYLSQPLSDVTTVLGDLRARLLLSAAIALLLSSAVGLLFSRAIAGPLRRLTDAAGAVAQGELNQQVPVESRDELGRLSRAFNDMTARLQAARQMQVDFVANVSHELRTPLTAVKGMVETLRDGAVDDPEVRDRFLETVESETDRLIRLVNDLLLLSRTDSGGLNLRCESLDMLALVGDAVDRLSPQAEARGVVLSVEASATVPPAWADADWSKQVLFNLLDNAIKYSRPGGRVTIGLGEAREVVRSVLVEVRDEGIGIPPEDLPHIGQRFYRTDRARSRADGGSGLGLAIAQALVQAQGGRLRVESKEGEGTVVSFTLPSP